MTPLFKQKDNADAQLNASINASTLILIVKSGEGALFPQPVKSSATSLGSSTVLNKTGAGALGLTVGDYIFNITDGSWAFIIAVNTNDIETTPLYGGFNNTWQSADEFATRRFVATLNKRDAQTGAITSSEQVLIQERAGDTLTVPTGGRGYNGTTPLPFGADDYLSILIDELLPDGIESVMSGIDNKKFEKDFSQSVPNDTALKALNNAGSASIDLLKLTTADILEFQTHPRTFSGRVIANNQDLVDLQYYIANLPAAAGTVNYTLGESIFAEELVSIDFADEKIYRTDATDAVSVANCRGVLTTIGVLNDVRGVQSDGIIDVTGVVADTPYYLSDTLGAISTAPGTFERMIGIGEGAGKLNIDLSDHTTSGNDTFAPVGTGIINKPHNLGRMPKKIRINWGTIGTTNQAHGSAVIMKKDTFRNYQGPSNDGFVAVGFGSPDIDTGDWEGDLTFDETNIILDVTTYSSGETTPFLFEAE